jgi:thiamine biosynthesis protein ThiS
VADAITGDAVTDTRIAITLNGEPRRVASGQSVDGLLSELGLHPRLVVVEHNRHILERSRYLTTSVEDGDVLELVHFVGGG